MAVYRRGTDLALFQIYHDELYSSDFAAERKRLRREVRGIDSALAEVLAATSAYATAARSEAAAWGRHDDTDGDQVESSETKGASSSASSSDASEEEDREESLLLEEAVAARFSELERGVQEALAS